MRIPTLAAVAALASAAAGCTGGGAAAAQLRDLRARLDASDQARTALTRKVEDLDNRVFLLADQVESQKVALARRGGEPRLPVVTLQPAEAREPEPTAAVATTVDGDAVRTLPAESDAPEAAPRDPPRAISSGARPKLSLRGDAVPWLGSTDDSSSTETIAGDAPLGPVTSATRRARRAPTTHAGNEPRPPSAATPQVASDEEPTALYREAYGRLKAGQPEQAAAALRDFVTRYPQHDLADNAQYWLGESFYARADYKDAIPEFRAVVRRWPSGNKVPDALLKLGFCHLQLGDQTEGRATLAEVADHYPKTEAAQLATRRLSELSPEKKP